MAVNAEHQCLPAHGAHYLLPHLLLALDIEHFPDMVHLHISSDLTTVFTFIGIETADKFSSSHCKPFCACGYIHLGVDGIGGLMVGQPE